MLIFLWGSCQLKGSQLLPLLAQQGLVGRGSYQHQFTPITSISRLGIKNSRASHYKSWKLWFRK